MSYLYGSPTPSCRTPRHLLPHITYCPEPRTAITLSDKNVSKGGRIYNAPRREDIIPPQEPLRRRDGSMLDTPAFEGISRGSLCTHVYTLVYSRVYSCVHVCTLLRSYREAEGALSEGPPASQGGQAVDDRWGGEWEDYHSPRLVVSTAWEGEGRLCLRGRVASPGATYEGCLRAALSPSGAGELGVWLSEYWHLPNTCYICNERYSSSTMHPTRAPSQPLELE